MKECTGYTPSNDGQAPETPISLDEAFAQTVQDCPGCLYNCYMMEESIGWTGNNLKEKFRNLLFLILELPTIYQTAKIMATEKNPVGEPTVIILEAPIVVTPPGIEPEFTD